MNSFEDNIKDLKKWINIDIRSPKTRNILIKKVDFHIDNPDLFSPTLYEANSHKFSELGQAAITITILSKNWSTTLTTVKAVCKFKRLLKNKKSTSTEHNV